VKQEFAFRISGTLVRHWLKIILAMFVLFLVLYGAMLLINRIEPTECVLTTCKSWG
jgi:hypothetical protein